MFNLILLGALLLLSKLLGFVFTRRFRILITFHDCQLLPLSDVGLLFW